MLGGLQEQVLCLRRIAVPLDDFGTDLRHGAVAAAFGNGVPKVCKSLLIFPVIQKRIQRDRTGMVDDLRIFRAKQKPCGIRGIGIEEREHCQQALFQRRIAVCILLRVNPEDDMESRAGTFFSFWFLMMAAEVQHIGNIGKELRNILRGDPICRYIRVVVAAVHGQSVGGLKVWDAPMAIFVLGTDHIFGKCWFYGDFIRDIHFIGIPAVGRISDAVCRVHGNRFVFSHKISSFFSLFGSTSHPVQSVQ